MPDEKKPIQVNTDFTNFPELLADLDKMVEQDGMDRSKFIRKLVRQESARRAQLPLPLPDAKLRPSPQPSPEGRGRKRRQQEAVAA